MVYDLTRRSSFENLTQWLKELRAHAEPDITIMLAGNKTDACEQDPAVRRITKEEGEKFAASQGTMFAETSAVSNVNVREAFEGLLQSLSPWC